MGHLIRWVWAFVCLSLYSTLCFAQSLDIQGLQEIIQKYQIRTIEELIPHLGDYRKNYVVMLNSQSRQGASIAYPRVILYPGKPKIPGKLTSQMVLSFNTDLQESGYYDIEVLQLSKNHQEYEFYAIHFAPDARSEPEISEKNPAACRACHGQNPRPIWEKLPIWQGTLESTRFYNTTPLYVETLQRTQNKNSRLKLLQEISDPTHSTYGFNFYINDLYSLNIAKTIEQEPKLKPYWYALLGALYCNIPDYQLTDFYADSKKSIIDQNYQDVLPDIRKKFKKHFERRVSLIERYLGELPPNSTLKAHTTIAEIQSLERFWYTESEMVAKLRTVVESTSVPMNHWSMSFARTSYSFDHHFFRSLLLWQSLIQHPDFDPELSEWITKYHLKDDNPDRIFKYSPKIRKFCKLLKKKSLLTTQ